MVQGNTVKNKQLAQSNEREQRASSPSQPMPSQGGRITRRTTAATAANATAASNVQQMEPKPSYEEARSHLKSMGLLPTSEPASTQLLAKALDSLASDFTRTPPANVQKTILALSEVASKIVAHCEGCKRAENLPDIITDSRQTLQIEILELNDKVEELEKKIVGKIEEAAENLDRTAAVLNARLDKEANAFPSQQGNAAPSYRDALLRNPTLGGAGNGAQSRDIEGEISLETERKERQVLIECDGEQILANSYEVIIEKATFAISQVTDPAPPEGLQISQVVKTRKNDLLINFNTKEAARWLRQPGVATTFTTHFFFGSTIKQRQYSLIAPRVPLSFDPENPVNLREIEEGNGLENNVIAKARWIKPAYRRKAEQTVAHMTLMLNDVNQANKCIKEGLYICGATIFPTRLKQEPIQCMKCRKWGHYATECRESKNTCGTCGGDHRTNECTELSKRYCVSCNSSTHASWDRKCPEFARRCAWYDTNHPDNSLKFFPTDEAWTQSYRPPKIPFAERFPARFAVGSLPPPNRKERELPTRAIGKNTKRPRRKGKNPPDHYTREGNDHGDTVLSQSRVDDNPDHSEEEVQSVISNSTRCSPSEAYVSFNSFDAN